MAAGGTNSSSSLSSAELYNPITGVWTPTAPLATARNSFKAVLLQNGKVLAVGGVSGDQGNLPLATAELYNPVGAIWAPTGSLATARSSFGVAILSGGKILTSGGFGTTAELGSSELYNPVSGSWSAAASLVTPRRNFNMIKL